MSGWAQSVGKALGGAFLSPVYLWFLGLIPIVILLYLLKLRRTEVIISSTLLWLKSLQDMTANAPFQRLRKNLLLFLQILILLAVIAALSRPYFSSAGLAGQNLCLLIDRSASMQTMEDGVTRLDAAKERALGMVREMRRGDKAMVLAFAETSDVLCELTDDRVHLRDAINRIQAVDTRTKLRDAFLVTQSLGQTVPDLHAVIFSDGNIADLAELKLSTVGRVAGGGDNGAEGTASGYDMSFVQVGESTNNAGVVVFSMREPLEGAAGDRQTFVLVHNADTAPLQTTVTLSFESSILAVEEIEVPPGGDTEVVFAHPELGAGILKAEIDHEDALDADNTAWLALRPAAVVKVLLVADPDGVSAYFLQRVLMHDPRVELSTLSPENYAPTDEYDLTLFDNYAPETLPQGTLVFFNALPSIEGLGADGVIENPPVIATDAEHPLMRFNLNPGNVSIQSAQRLTVPAGARSVVSTTGGPLIADVSRGGQQILVVGFDVGVSDWPLNLSYPLFFQNLLAWVPRASLASEPYVVAGRPLSILSSPDFETATVTLPGGTTETVNLDPLRPVYFANTEQTGLYQVTYGGKTEVYAVNVLDRVESSIGPAAALKTERGTFEAQRGAVKQRRELWRWLLGGAIAVLTLEWWIYSRRAWI